MLLLDVVNRAWSDKLLSLLHIDKALLPRLHESYEVSATLNAQGARSLGLTEGTPVVGGAGDQAAGAVGNGIVMSGIVSATLGTSGVVFAHADEFRPDPSGRLHAFCHAVPERYHLMAVTLAAGGGLRWWRELLGSDDYERLTAEAAAVPPGAEGLLFLPYLSGERTPHLDPAARGAFIGLTARHTRAHLTRAVLEGVAFSLHEGFALIRELGVPIGEVRATGGGARSGLWRQILADTLELPVRRVVAEEGPAYGAALLGGVAAGVWRDLTEAAKLVRLRPAQHEPDPAGVRVYAEYTALYRTLYPALRGAMGQLTALASA